MHKKATAQMVQRYRASFSGLSREVWSSSGVMLINRAGTMVLPFLSVYPTQQLGFSLAYLQFYLFGPLAGAAVCCMLFLTVGEMLSLPFISTLALRFTNDRNRGQYMALFIITYSVSHILVPKIGFQIADRLGFSTLWVLLLLLAVAGAVGFWRIRGNAGGT